MQLPVPTQLQGDQGGAVQQGGRQELQIIVTVAGKGQKARLVICVVARQRLHAAIMLAKPGIPHQTPRTQIAGYRSFRLKRTPH